MMAPLPIIAAGISAAGTIMGGISQANAASYQAQVARNNAKAAQNNAAYAAKATAAQTEAEGLKAAQRLGGVTTALAANNIDTSSGSAADTIQSQRELGQLDVANVANRGALQVYGYETEATSFEAQAKADKAQVLPDIVGSVLKAGGSALANPAVDSAIGGPQVSGGGGASGAADNGFSSFPQGSIATDPSFEESALSGSSSVPAGYSWMLQSDGTPADPEFNPTG